VRPKPLIPVKVSLKAPVDVILAIPRIGHELLVALPICNETSCPDVAPVTVPVTLMEFGYIAVALTETGLEAADVKKGTDKMRTAATSSTPIPAIRDAFDFPKELSAFILTLHRILLFRLPSL